MANEKIIRLKAQYSDVEYLIPDEGKLALTYPNGKKGVATLEYIDDEEFGIEYDNGDAGTFKMSEFAEFMDEIGIYYEPLKFDLQTMEEADVKFAYSGDGTDRGEIGYLRADFGRNGNEFYSTFFDECAERKTADFKREFQELIDYLRFDAPWQLLGSLKEMERVLLLHKGLVLKDTMPGSAGYKVVTEKHTYFIRCIPLRNNYNAYIHCYINRLLETSTALAVQYYRFSRKDDMDE